MNVSMHASLSVFLVGTVPWFLAEILSKPWVDLAYCMHARILKRYFVERVEDYMDVQDAPGEIAKKLVDTFLMGTQFQEEAFTKTVSLRDVYDHIRKDSSVFFSDRPHHSAASVADFDFESDEIISLAQKEIPKMRRARALLLLLFVAPLLNVALLVACVRTLWGSIATDLNALLYWLILATVYLTTLAQALSYRVYVKMTYGGRSEAADDLDRKVLRFFGIHILKRGSSNAWAYPVFALAPAAALFIVGEWFNRSLFPVTCKMGVNGTMIMDPDHCLVLDDPWDISQMVSYLVPKLLAVFAAVKAYAALMIKMDPRAKATLSMLRAWEQKCELELTDHRQQAPSMIP